MERSKTFLFKENSYQIEFPTVGQYLDIENAKIKYSNGGFGSLISVGTVSGLRAIQIIECLSVITVLCPDLMKDLKVDILKIDAKDFISLLNCYKKEIFPWYYDWYKEFDEIIEKSI